MLVWLGQVMVGLIGRIDTACTPCLIKARSVGAGSSGSFRLSAPKASRLITITFGRGVAAAACAPGASAARPGRKPATASRRRHRLLSETITRSSFEQGLPVPPRPGRLRTSWFTVARRTGGADVQRALEQPARALLPGFR